MKLSEVGEFGLIHRIEPWFADGLAGAVGIGDDCAILPASDGWATLVTTDLLIEDVHFLRARIPPRHLGRKTVAVNVSDIAAMGGEPTACFLSVGFPADIDIDWLDEFFGGIREAGRETGCPLLGGDTTRSPRAIVINLAVVGRARRDRLKLRSGAQVGDALVVTGWLGDSGGGLQLLLRGLPIDSDDARYLVEVHHNPRPHLPEGRWLAQRPEVRAMMDVSDGIDSDIRRILEQSRLGGAVVDLDALPVSAPLRRMSERHRWAAEELAAAAGEDYCLLAAIDPHRVDAVVEEFARAFGRPLWKIGVLTAEGGLVYRRGGKEAMLTGHGFDHFKA